ncbi:MAG TPA: Uma2 family endonuclease [Dehalococcoidia bacterium]|nr:Uma2 family endonuclease [Dehalococcoidia bacterium]
MAIPHEQLTLAAFLQLPEQEPALEYLEGEVRQKVSPKGQHSRLQTKWAEWVNRFAEPLEMAAAFTELRTTFGGASAVPDVVVFRWDRLPVDADGNVVNDVDEPPDLVIEIVSPDQSVAALIRRCQWYVNNGVLIALLVDPSHRSVRAFRPGHEPALLRGADLIDVCDVLPGFRLTVREMFAALTMRPSG